VRFVPQDTANKAEYRSSDTGVAKVDNNGRITAVGAGDVLIRVNALGIDSVKDSCKVSVKRDPPVLTVSPDQSGNLGDELSFTIGVSQEYGGIKALKWDLNGDGTYDSTLSDTARKDTAVTRRHRYMQAGTFDAKFHVEDTEGNRDSLTRRVVIGSQAPFVVITKPSRDTTLTTLDFTVEYTADGVPKTKTPVLVEGRNHVEVAESSSTSGLVGRASVVIWVDTKAPVVDIVSPQPGFLTRNASVAVSWIVDNVPQTTRNTESLAGK
jgi:hypothetical protein